KVISPQVVHKSDAGGVVTGISDLAGAMEAFRSIHERVSAYLPDAEITGIIAEQQVVPGLELIIGGKVDPAFGKVITFGLGGIFVELLKDVAIRILPVSDEDLKSMVREIKGYRLIKGFRGQPVLDEEALFQVLRSVAQMFRESPTLTEFDINPVILHSEGVIAVDARIYVDDDAADLKSETSGMIDPEIFYPSCIAVIGASSDPKKVGYAVFRNLLHFPGKLYAVNPNHAEVLGKTAYPSIAAVPDIIEMAVIAVPAGLVPKVLAEAGEKGIRLAVIVSSGFREAGEEGQVLENRVKELAKHYGIRIVGPNSLGIMLPNRSINTTFDPISALPGHIGFISQSGAIITTMVDWSLPEEIGFSAVISVGNQADLGFVDYLRFVLHDPDTRVVILYIEEIKDGCEFMKVVGEVTKVKPVIALKSGSSVLGKIAASSHTGSLAGSYEIYQAAFRQAGVTPAYSLREAFDMGELLASEGYPHGKTAVVITGAGGFAVLASDYAEKFGIDLCKCPGPIMDELNAILPSNWNHANPIDLIGDAGPDRFARVFDVMIRHQDLWDIAFVIHVPSAMLDPAQLAQEIVRFSKATHKMVVGCLLGGDSMKKGMRILRKQGIPNYSDIEDAFRAVGRILSVREGIKPSGQD
ncbi:MAG: acetate--CoA ligase family protein, partial [Methanoregulaceae archaeon]|nr:acetate--CoA ligase family protein [Methanoregulaceae archaeon]